MFIPIGLGSWPKRLPLGILSIAGLCLYLSIPHFTNLEKIEDLAKSDSKQLIELRNKVIQETCLGELSLQQCSLLEAAFAGKKAEHSESSFSYRPSWKSVLEAVQDASEVQSFIKRFANEKTWPQDAFQTSSYPLYKAEMDRLTNEIENQYNQEGIASQKNLNLQSLTRSSFMHADWIHLWANLIMLFIFGWAVEQRIGSFRTLLGFIAGSYLGLGAEVLVSSRPILGASAGVLMIMGAYYVFFFKSQLKFVFTFGFLYFRSFYFPVAWTLPIFFFVHDIIGAFDLSVDRVAHTAHLGGLLTGLCLAWFYKKKQPLPRGAIYEQEIEILSRLDSSQNPEEAWKYFQEGASWNMQSRPLLDSFIFKALEFHMKLDSKRQKYFLSKLSFHFQKIHQKDHLQRASELLDQVRNFSAIMPLLRLISWQNCLQIADHSIQHGRIELALEIYEHALSLKLPLKTQELVRSAIQSIHQALQPKLKELN